MWRRWGGDGEEWERRWGGEVEERWRRWGGEVEERERRERGEVEERERRWGGEVEERERRGAGEGEERERRWGGEVEERWRRTAELWGKLNAVEKFMKRDPDMLFVPSTVQKEGFPLAPCEEVSPRPSQLHIPSDKARLSRVFLMCPTSGCL